MIENNDFKLGLYCGVVLMTYVIAIITIFI